MGNNPTTFSDPFGLMADTVEVQAHRVKLGPLPLGYYHASIRITPDDQDRWRNDARFRKGGDGRVFVTIGAGPKGLGRLVSDLNRPTDTRAGQLSTGVDLGGREENAVIETLLGLDAAYSDEIPYGGNRGYNSNSFVAGILGAAGLAVPSLGVELPGSTRPIPSRLFGGAQ